MPDIFISPPTISPPSPPASGRKTKDIGQALSAYLFMPEGVRFETQEPGETIILLLRRHWITNFFWLAIGFFLIITPLIFLPTVSLAGLLPVGLPSRFLSFLILIWYLLVFSYLLVNFLLWYFTVSIVTNERIIDIDYINILNKKFSATRIARIEDVTMRRGGFIRAIFDYGDVVVQTAAREVQFEFGAVPHPEQVVRIINELMGKTEEGIGTL